MPAIVTNAFRIAAGDYFQNDLNTIPTYIYFGGPVAWQDESVPPDVVDSTLGQIGAINDITGMKRIYEFDMISVIPRRDWTPNTVYDQYNDFANIIDDKNPETDDFYKFYVITDEFNVYKCISNNNRSQSTVKPTGQQTTNLQTPDGYVWKYMYTVLSTDAFKFMTPNFIPCYSVNVNNGTSQWLVQQSAIKGTVDHIEILNPGVGYSSTNPPVVNIIGDGSGATAIANVNDVTTEVESITITNPGSNYTETTVTISGGDGLGAEAQAYVSPINGHGSNARQELGATYKMIRVVIEDDENGILPTNIEFRKAGIIIEPLTNKSGVKLVVSDASLYEAGETVTGQLSLATGRISSTNKQRNELWLESVVGQFQQNEVVSSQPYNTTECLSVESVTQMPLTQNVVSGSDYVPLSGRPLFISNREKIKRGENQIEEFRFVVSF